MSKRQRLADMNLLTGQIEEITMTDFRASPGDVIDSVLMGKTFIITRQGKPLACLQRLPGERLSMVVGKTGKGSYTP